MEIAIGQVAGSLARLDGDLLTSVIAASDPRQTLRKSSLVQRCDGYI